MRKYIVTALILTIAISSELVASAKVRERRIEVEAISPPSDKSEEKNVNNHVEANPNVNISLDGRHESNVPVAQPATDEKPDKIEIYHHQQYEPKIAEPVHGQPVQITINEDSSKNAIPMFLWGQQAMQSMILQNQFNIMRTLQTLNPWQVGGLAAPMLHAPPSNLDTKKLVELYPKSNPAAAFGVAQAGFLPSAISGGYFGHWPQAFNLHPSHFLEAGQNLIADTIPSLKKLPKLKSSVKIEELDESKSR